MKIPQNLPRFSDYTREGGPPPAAGEGIRLPAAPAGHLGVPRGPQGGGRLCREGCPHHGRGLGHLPGEMLFLPLPPGVPQGGPARAWSGASQLHPRCAGPPTCPPRSCATWGWRWPPSTAGTSPRTAGISPPKSGACSRWTEACPPPRESWPCGPGAPAWCGSTWPPAPRLTKGPWLWRAIPAWARPRCWPAPWTSASSLCSPTSPAAPAPPCTGQAGGDRRGHPAGVPLLVQPQLRQLHRGPRAAPL